MRTRQYCARCQAPASMRAAADMIDDAQLTRKLDLVLKDLPAVLRRLGCARGRRNLHVHALLITNDAPPRDLLKKFDGADTGALAELTRLLDTDRTLAMRIFGRASRTLTS